MIGLGSLAESMQAKSKRRFNLLMLEEREYYFHDYGGYLHVPEEGSQAAATPFAARRKLKGRIHVCSKSIVFDPDDFGSNILRLPFRDCASIVPRRATDGTDYFVVHTRCAVEIPPHASYIFHKLNLASPDSEYIISLAYESAAVCLAFVNQLHGLYRLPNSGAGPGTKAYALAELIRNREEGIAFEASSIVDIRERALLPNGAAILAQQVQPLLLSPGRFQLTDARIYFQNFNNVSSETCSKVDIADIKRAYKRRYVMRDTALELFVASGKGGVGGGGSSGGSGASSSSSSSSAQTSVYFNFATKEERDMVHACLCSSPRFAPSASQSLASMTASWVRGDTSSFDYLLYLNQHSGRSWMDLTQYPVFPWVLRDYTSATLDLSDPAVYRDLSKPIGALNPERLAMFQRRMRDMPPEISHGQPFLYGTHYLCPGYVLYYLVRRCPQYQLRLQNGKFDHPDRLFHNMAGTWRSVLEAPTDVKELIPEFYASAEAGAGAGDFLRNSLELELGSKQSGHMVDDVELPPWAHGSPRQFVAQMRAALESPHVSAHLHQWIDLIFGYAQRGEAAAKANNLFHPLTYEGTVDLDAIADPTQRRSMELQINEFGQTPRQIFFRPHPQRFSDYDEQAEQAEAEAESASHADAAAASQLSPNSSSAFAMAQSSFMRSLSDEGLPDSPVHATPALAIPGSAAAAAAAAAASSSFAFPSLQLSTSPMPTLPMGQLLSSSSTSPGPLSRTAADLELLEKGSQALQLAAEVHNIQTRQLQLDHEELSLSSSPAVRSAVPFSTSSATHRAHSKAAWAHVTSDGWSRRETLSLHRDTVTCVQFGAGAASPSENLVSVSADGHLKIYSLSTSKLIRSAKVCDMNLSSCCVTPDGRQVYVSSWDNSCLLYNIARGHVVSSVAAHDDAVACMAVRDQWMITGSWDTTVKLRAVSEAAIEPLPSGEFTEHEAPVTAVAMDQHARVAVSGSDDGALIMWDTRVRDGHARQIEGFHSGVKDISFSPFASDFLVCSADGLLRHIDASTGKALFEIDTQSDVINCMRTDGFSVVAVGEAGVVRGWNLRTAEEVMSVHTGLGPQVAIAVNHDASTFCVANQKATLFEHADSA